MHFLLAKGGRGHLLMVVEPAWETDNMKPVPLGLPVQQTWCGAVTVSVNQVSGPHFPSLNEKTINEDHNV